MNNLSKHAFWAVSIKNSICIIAFTVLSIVFEKWWIVLFSALFFSGLKIKED